MTEPTRSTHLPSSSTVSTSMRVRRWPLALLAARTAILYSCQMALTTTLLLTFEDTNPSGWHLSGVLLAISVPMMLVAPSAGAMADRLGSRALIGVGGLVQVAAATSLLLDPAAGIAIALVALYAVGMAIAAAALQAELPTLVPVERLGRATGLVSAAQTSAFMIGPMGGAVMYDAAGRDAALTVVALACVAMTLSIVAPRSRPTAGTLPPVPGTTSKESRGRWFGGLWVVDRVSLVVVLYTGTLALMLHPTAVLEVMLVRESMGASATVLGVVGAAWSVGMVTGSLAAGRWRITSTNLSRWLLISGGVQAAFLGTAGLAHAPWLLVTLYAFGGFWSGATNVARQTLVTVRAPEGRRGRALALVVAVHNGVQALGLALGGLAVQLYDARMGYLLCGLLGVVSTVAFMPWLRRVTTDKR